MFWKAVVVWFLPQVGEKLLLACKVRVKSFAEAAVALHVSPASYLIFSLQEKD